MADKGSFPQIPRTVWWGVRSLLDRSPNAKVDDGFLSADLGVQQSASKLYLAELRRAGVINEDGKATPLGQKWRLDDTYGEAVEGLISAIYPEQLRQLGPIDSVDRTKVVAWFKSQGLGDGAAKNKASTYFLLGSTVPNDAPAAAAPKNNSTKAANRSPGKRAKVEAVQPPPPAVPAPIGKAHPTEHRDVPGLNVNLQIHISADATTDQIESIFSAMKRYLYANDGD